MVHRRVKCPRPGGGNSERYYIETSSCIPFDSTDTPTVAICLAILLTTLNVLPDIPTLPSEDAPTPYTAGNTTDDSQARFLVIPHYASAGQPVFVHFDVPGFATDTVFATETLATQEEFSFSRWETTYEEWLKRIRRDRIDLTNAGDRRALDRDEFFTLANSPATVCLTEVLSGGEPMTFVGCFGGQPVQAWYSSPVIYWVDPSFARQALLFRRNLAHLQGKVVPHFLGLYLADPWSLVVTEYCGRIVCTIEDLPESERCAGSDLIIGAFLYFLTQFACYCRIALYSGFYEIHKAGVMMPDLSFRVARNAVGQFRIVDFSEAEPGHKCPGHKKCEALKFGRDYDCKLSKYLVFIDCLGHWPVYDTDMHVVLPCSKDRIPTREELKKGLRLF
jgi:hypothetical protein